MSDVAAWRNVHIGFEDDGLKISGAEVWKHKWRQLDIEPRILPHPTHPKQMHNYPIYEIGDPSRPLRFAASELSNGVWGFYIPIEAASAGCSEASERLP